MNKEIDMKMFQHCNDNSRNIALEHQRDYDLLVERHTKLFDDYKKLEEENKKLNIKLLDFHSVFCDKQHTINDLRDRTTKAIEYIEKNKQIGMFADLRKEGTHHYTIECDADDLLNILKGEE